MSLRKLLFCCCCPESLDKEDGINLNVNISSNCCQKTHTVYRDDGDIKRNLFQRAASSIIRRNKKTTECDSSYIKSCSEDIFKSAVDISIPQTHSTKF